MLCVQQRLKSAHWRALAFGGKKKNNLVNLYELFFHAVLFPLDRAKSTQFRFQLYFRLLFNVCFFSSLESKEKMRSCVAIEIQAWPILFACNLLIFFSFAFDFQ